MSKHKHGSPSLQLTSRHAFEQKVNADRLVRIQAGEGKRVGSIRSKEWTRSKAQKKRIRYLANKQARAELYSSNQGQISANNVPLWHSTLKALSAGALG